MLSVSFDSFVPTLSPQPSQTSGATRRHPRRLRLTNRASRRSAPTLETPHRTSAPPREILYALPPSLPLMSPLGLPSAGYPASARWHVFRSRRSVAFTLLEVIVATAVLSMMMAFLFNLLGSSAKLWETGNKKIEAAQAARIGLNIIASDLQNAFAGNMTSYTTNGTAIYNIAPFQAIPTPSSTLGLGGGAISTNGSQQLCGVLLSNNSSVPYNEFGYQCVYLSDADGIDPMIGKRCYLVKKVDGISTTGGNFYFRNSTPNSTWYTDSTEFYPLIDNCIRLTFEYYGNTNSATGQPGWTTTWPPTDRLPLGVLVTVTVIDSKTAEKVAQLCSGDPTTASDANVQRLIRQGSETMSRFIPFNSN